MIEAWPLPVWVTEAKAPAPACGDHRSAVTGALIDNRLAKRAGLGGLGNVAAAVLRHIGAVFRAILERDGKVVAAGLRQGHAAVAAGLVEQRRIRAAELFDIDHVAEPDWVIALALPDPFAPPSSSVVCVKVIVLSLAFWSTRLLPLSPNWSTAMFASSPS